MLTSTGIGSGLDIEGLVSQLVTAERAPTESRIAQQQSRLAAKLSSMGQFQGALASLRDAQADLNQVEIFTANAFRSSNPQSVSGSARPDAAAVSFELSVQQLAQAHTLASPSFSSKSESVGEGELTIHFGTTDYVPSDPGPESYNGFLPNPSATSLTLQLNANNNSLEQLRDRINQSGAPLSASIVQDGSGYRLVLVAANTGVANSMQIEVTDAGDGSDVDALGLSRFAFSATATQMQQTREALDALVSLNGLDIRSASNSLDNAIDGVSLSLKQVTQDPVAISLVEDFSLVESRIGNFVKRFNDFMDTVNRVAGYDADLARGGVLQGDFTVRSLTSQIRDLLSKPVPGALSAFSYLSEVGIRTGQDGRLQLDSDQLQAALGQDAGAVAALFVNRVQATDSEVRVISSPAISGVQSSWPLEIAQMPTRASLLGAPISLPITLDSQSDSFSLMVDGTLSAAINLVQGSYSDGDQLAEMIRTAMDTDNSLKESGKVPDLIYNASDNRLEFRSVDWGSDTAIELLSVDPGVELVLGLVPGPGTGGSDIVGSIGGEQARGNGDVLTAAAGSVAEGVALSVTGGSAGSRGDINYYQGISGLIQQLADRYLLDEGPLAQRTGSINDRLDGLEQQRERLERRMVAVEARYRDQFNSLDSMLAQLQSTSTFLSQQLANLPGPRKLGNQ